MIDMPCCAAWLMARRRRAKWRVKVEITGATSSVTIVNCQLMNSNQPMRPTTTIESRISTVPTVVVADAMLLTS